MKQTQELLSLLVEELNKNLEKIKSIKKSREKVSSYNELLGKTSYILAGLLEAMLKEFEPEWDSERWIDDSLIYEILIEKKVLKICGTIIWGKLNTTEQWTDSFVYEILLDRIEGFKYFTYFFIDEKNPGILYEKYQNSAYLNSFSTINWKYVLSSDLFTQI